VGLRPSLVAIAGSNPAGGVDVSRNCCVLSGRGPCECPIIRSEGSTERVSFSVIKYYSSPLRVHVR
jgi:hypothetical protein